MSQTRYLPAALRAIGKIYGYTEQRFGEAQADKYVQGLFTRCANLATSHQQSIPKEFGVEGFFARYEKHFIHWRFSEEDDVIIVCILHHQMDLLNRLSDALEENEPS